MIQNHRSGKQNLPYWKLAFLFPLLLCSAGGVAVGEIPLLPKGGSMLGSPGMPVAALAQQLAVNGKVADSDGNPLAGATVTEKGTRNATTTGADGQFALTVSGTNATLTVTSIGYQTAEVRAARGSLQITLLPDAEELDEVVIVGFGVQKRANLTSAVSEVDPKMLRDRPAPSAANMLQGASPGLVVTRNSGRPGEQGLNIQVRGATSANGDVAPLIVIDGVISSDDAFQALNPSDIANISVLKDGGATAIYGAQSAGGVLLVTTKGGEKGRSRISLSSNLASSRPGNLPGRLSLIDEMNYMNLARANAGLGPEYTAEDLDYAVNGPVFVLGNNNKWRTYNRENLIDRLIRKSYGMYNNNLQLAGGGEKVTYLASLGNMTQQGAFKVGADKFTRWNARANVSARVNDYLKIDIRSAYINQDNDKPQDGGNGLETGGNNIMRQFFSSRMRFPLFNEDGSYYRQGTSSAFGYALLEAGGFKTETRGTYFNNVTATLDNFAKGLEIRLMYGREDERREYRDFRRTVMYYDGPRNPNNPNTNANPINNPNRYAIENRAYSRVNYQAIADYDLTIASDHNFHLMGGYQFFDYDRRDLEAVTTNLYVNDNPSLNFTASQDNKNHTQRAQTEKMQSYFGRFNYNFREKYLFEATVRSDESSRLSAGNRVKVFPSFSVGWNMAKEGWFDGLAHIVDEAKPRVSWGKVGSKQGIGYYDYLRQLLTRNDIVLGGGRQTGVYLDMLPATGLSWETVETQNFGMDFGFLNRRLRGSFDYYNKFNNNMLVAISLPGTIGVKIPKSNGGQLKTWGWEAALSYGDRAGADFTYSVGLSLSDSQNRLVKYGGANDVVTAGVVHLLEGYALNSAWGYRTDGYFQTADELASAPSYTRLSNATTVPGLGDIRYVDVDGNGEISIGQGRLGDTGDLVHLGDINPRYQYGLNVNLGYKAFDLGIFVQGIGKRRFKPANVLIQPAGASWFLPMDFQTDYWTPENPDAAFPRPYLGGGHNFQASDKWFLDGAYTRLKNVQIGYTLSKRNVQRLPFSRVRIYASGEDLLTISKLGALKKAIDPEIKPEGSLPTDTKKDTPYPFPKTISFGLNLDF